MISTIFRFLISTFIFALFSGIPIAAAAAIPVALTVVPPNPGLSMTLKFTCAPPLRGLDCVRSAMPTRVFVEDRKPGPAREITFTPIPGNDAIALTLSESPLDVGQWVYVQYNGGRSRTPDIPVVPAPGDVTCCLFGDGDSPRTVIARVPVDDDVRMETGRKDGAPRLLPLSQRPDREKDWQVVFTIPAGYSLTPGDTVKLFVVLPAGRIDLGQATFGSTPDGPPRPSGHRRSRRPDPDAHCVPPYLPDAPATSDTIKVVLGCYPAHPNEDLEVDVDGHPQTPVVWSLLSTSPITYSARLPVKLKPKQAVKVIQQGQVLDSMAQIVSDPSVPKPQTIVGLQEGATSVTGFADGAEKARVEVYDSGELKERVDAAVDSSSGKFTAGLSSPLQAEQEVKVFGLNKGNVSDSPETAEVRSFGLDWGRVRAYFTAGVLVSNNNNALNASSANTFLDFNIDKGWLHRSASPDGLHGNIWNRLRFHTFFDARLTAIPDSSASNATPTPSTSTTTRSTSSESNSSRASQTNPPAGSGNTGLDIASRLTNRQAASLQIGGYFPLIVTRWSYRHRANSLIVAPLVKTGFYTLTGSEHTDANTLLTINRNDNGDRFFTFYAYGLRVGHQREFLRSDGRTDGNRAPDLLSYIDFTVGHWSNLEAVAPYAFTTGSDSRTCTDPITNLNDLGKANCAVRLRPWRYGFEGILKIPSTPLIIGLSANVAAQHVKGPNFFSPPDDLRFLFGARFDANKFMGVLSKFGGQ